MFLAVRVWKFCSSCGVGCVRNAFAALHRRICLDGEGDPEFHAAEAGVSCQVYHTAEDDAFSHGFDGEERC